MNTVGCEEVRNKIKTLHQLVRNVYDGVITEEEEGMEQIVVAAIKIRKFLGKDMTNMSFEQFMEMVEHGYYVMMAGLNM